MSIKSADKYNSLVRNAIAGAGTFLLNKEC